MRWKLPSTHRHWGCPYVACRYNRPPGVIPMLANAMPTFLTYNVKCLECGITPPRLNIIAAKIPAYKRAEGQPPAASTHGVGNHGDNPHCPTPYQRTSEQGDNPLRPNTNVSQTQCVSALWRGLRCCASQGRRGAAPAPRPLPWRRWWQRGSDTGRKGARFY